MFLPSATDPALYTGAPQTPDLPELMQKIQQVFARNQLSNNGPEVQALEAEIAAWAGVKHCIAVANATLGLLFALKALDLQGEVVLPAFTFPATANVLPWLNLKPVFVDVDPLHHNMTAAAVEAALTPQTAAILGVQIWGYMEHVEGLRNRANRQGIPLIMDAAHALGCGNQQQRPAGSHGRVEVFSLHATKFIHGLEGGLICTSDTALAEGIRAWIQFGYREGQVQQPGLNAKMNEISAAVARHNWQHRVELTAHHQRIYEAYQRALQGIAGLRLYQHLAGSNYQYVVLEVLSDFGPDANAVQQHLQTHGIYSKRYFEPLHHSPAYRSLRTPPLPVTERLGQQVLVLPGGQQMDVSQVERVCEALLALGTGEGVRG